MLLPHALAALYARGPRGVRLGLENVQKACIKLGRPERAYRVVHVAGTNGKGSVCALTESMLRASGLRTGLFTSPHLARFAERIRVGGAELGDDALADAIAQALAAGPELSFFEAATVAAFVAFRDAGVEVAVVEVGLGGRLDASNVVQPELCAITSIGLDHQAYLGDTLAHIAREKAGILKEGAACILGGLPLEAADEIARVAAQVGAPCEPAPACGIALSEVGVGGVFGTTNLDVAVALAERLGVQAAQVREGARNAQWPGRFETVQTVDGPWLFDGAHNAEGAARLSAELKHRALRPDVLLFGAMADKSWREMAGGLRAECTHAVYTAPPAANAARGPAQVAELAALFGGVTEPGVEQAMVHARALAGPEGLVLCAGSLYLVGEVRARVLGLPRDPPIAL